MDLRHYKYSYSYKKKNQVERNEGKFVIEFREEEEDAKSFCTGVTVSIFWHILVNVSLREHSVSENCLFVKINTEP